MPTGNYRAGIVLRAVAAIGVMLTIVYVSWFQKGELGYRSFGRGGAQYVVAGTTPIALLFSVLGTVLVFLVMRPELRVGDFRVSPLWRRYAAFIIDFWLSLFIFANVTSIVPLLLEAERTGSFHWRFERDFSVPSDWTMTVLILICIAAIPACFVVPLANRRQTVGFWILRIARVSSDGSVLSLPLLVAFRWSFREFTELFSPFSFWKTAKGRDAEGRTGNDRETGLMVVSY
jgi:hypothetical protein